MRSSPTLLCLAAIGLLWIAQPAFAQHAEDEAAKQKAKDDLDKEMRGLPFLGEYDLGEVIRFSFRGGRLRPVTQLVLPSGTTYALKLKGMPGAAKVQIISDASGLSGPDHNFIQFGYRDLTVRGTIAVYTDVLCGPELLNVSQSTDLPGGDELTVQLVPGAAGPRAVTLYIQLAPQRAIHYSAGSVAELALKYPQQVDEHLRPIFRLLRQEQVAFEADPRMACQILSADWPVDPKTADATNAAVARLAADSYADREAATGALLALGEPAAIYLMHADLRHMTTEQAMRVDLFLAPYRPLSEEEAQQLRSDADFLLDCLYSPDATVRSLALQRLRKVSGRAIDLDPHASGADFEAAVADLRQALVASMPLPQ